MRLARAEIECPHCLDTGAVTARDGSLDACGRCAKWAEIEWRSTNPARLRIESRPIPPHTAARHTNETEGLLTGSLSA
jgi:hypothetical protein